VLAADVGQFHQFLLSSSFGHHIWEGNQSNNTVVLGDGKDELKIHIDFASRFYSNYKQVDIRSFLSSRF